ncbi:MAG: hypothetical protein COB41_09140 [Proteobacteria bacterium]|nr:MAG: hypothetical protein COB41_09140 [Pseudomonadota bacterium]
MAKKFVRARSKLTDIHHNLAEILGVERLDQLVGLSRLRRLWPHIVGPMMAQRTEPIELKPSADGSSSLIIAVSHSTMAQQIIFLRDDIRKSCFEQARIGRIAKIFTRVQAVAGIQTTKNMPEAKPIPLQQKKQLASELQSIKNRPLRHAMFEARLAQLRYSTGDIS